MKFRITKDDFLDGLQQVQHVVSSRATLPILSNVLLEARDGELKLTTTDLDVGVSCGVSADVERAGETTLPARRLASIIRELPANDIDIEVDAKNVATIRSGPSFFRIIGLPGEDFPRLPDFQESREFKLSQAVLRDGLKKTSYAISTDETRYVLNGIFASFRDGKLSLVATDGRRLAMVENEIEFPQSQEIDIIIPTKAVSELQRLLGNEGEVKIFASESQVAFELNDAVLISKLIEGNYPNYRQVIPASTKERIVIDRDMLYTIVNRVSLLAPDKTSSVKLSFGPDSIEIASSAQEIGEAQETLPVTYSGSEFSIAFNPDFLMAPLRALSEDSIYLDLTDEMSPGVIRTEGSFLYVLMPMRINQG
ncbi:DNA polymerase III subunit beta [Sulfuriroseicoccus oceanibius]|uniref:Beta sliding clamp n=1 Tax=Sulfuriroseicoccus oceanibius TaxID=2707525 RepID=A0A6B3LF65_9BACT|nr:DNA polymerase III subunit beta [Sulfuriroseicoccus oceanibius]QQL45010.1 DNA polymerase III subunit beta [Sulfuriroseicoccus oceanibius]